jgi:hypothetical protein
LFFHFILILTDGGDVASKLVMTSNKLSKKSESSEEPTSARTNNRENAFKLLSLSLKQIETHEAKGEFREKDYLSLNSWLNLANLELEEPARFKDLTKSLLGESSKWTEYFQINKTNNCQLDVIEKDIDLLNQTPLSKDLSLIEKLAVWLCARPDKV